MGFDGGALYLRSFPERYISRELSVLLLPLHPDFFFKSSTFFSIAFLYSVIGSLLLCMLVGNIPWTQLFVLFGTVFTFTVNFTPIPVALCVDILFPLLLWLSVVKIVEAGYAKLGETRYWLNRLMFTAVFGVSAMVAWKALQFEKGAEQSQVLSGFSEGFGNMSSGEVQFLVVLFSAVYLAFARVRVSDEYFGLFVARQVLKAWTFVSTLNYWRME